MPTGEEPSCANAEKLALAIGRDTGMPTQVLDSPPDEPGHAAVFLRGDDLLLFVEVRRGESRVETALNAPACAAVPDVVAAFVASVLVPPPLLPPVGREPAAPPRQPRERPTPLSAPTPRPAKGPTCGTRPTQTGSPCERAPFLPPVLSSWRRMTKAVHRTIATEEAIAAVALGAWTLYGYCDDMADEDWLALGASGIWAASSAVAFAKRDDRYGQAFAVTGGLLGLGTSALAVSRECGRRGEGPRRECGSSGRHPWRHGNSRALAPRHGRAGCLRVLAVPTARTTQVRCTDQPSCDVGEARRAHGIGDCRDRAGASPPGLRLNDQERVLPRLGKAGEEHPTSRGLRFQCGATYLPAQHDEPLAKQCVFHHPFLPATHEIKRGAEEDARSRSRPIADSLLYSIPQATHAVARPVSQPAEHKCSLAGPRNSSQIPQRFRCGLAR